MTHWQANSPQRLRYYDDQPLTAQDLQDAANSETRLRELHVRALHNTWGVAMGFEVALNQSILQLGPGLAYDCRGREIVSTRPLLIPLPDSPTPPTANSHPVFDFVIRYCDRDTLHGDRPATGTCLGDSLPNEERPLWRWSYAGTAQPNQPPLPLADDVRLGEELPLVRLTFRANAQPQLDTSQRRNTQGLTRPHLASGQVRQGSLSIHGSPLMWSAQIDTSSGGFSSAGGDAGVFYMANLLAHPFSSTSEFTRLLPPRALQDVLGRVMGPFVAIASPHASGFTLEVRLAAPSSSQLSALFEQYRELRRSHNLTLPVGVHWLGVELVKGCPPLPIRELLTLPKFAYLLNLLPQT